MRELSTHNQLIIARINKLKAQTAHELSKLHGMCDFCIHHEEALCCLSCAMCKFNMEATEPQNADNWALIPLDESKGTSGAISKP